MTSVTIHKAFPTRKLSVFVCKDKGRFTTANTLSLFQGLKALSAWKTHPIPEMKHTVTKHNYYSGILVKPTPPCSGRCWNQRLKMYHRHSNHLPWGYTETSRAVQTSVSEQREQTGDLLELWYGSPQPQRLGTR